MLQPTAPRTVTLLLPILLLAAGPAAAVKGKPPSPELAAVRERLDASDPEGALALLAPYLRSHPKSAEGLLMRSTASILLGDTETGRADLERALDLDGSLREGWLNLGAVAISEKRYDQALEAFLKAEELDPQAQENDLNIGAVLLLSGRLAPASERFQAYLTPDGSGKPGGDAFYLVATNYALAGYAGLAVEHLKRAIEEEERMRRRARIDPNFSGLWSNPSFQELLAVDLYEPPPGAYSAERTFPTAYETRDGRLLRAVLDTLQFSNIPFDPNVEVTPGWALIWGDVRIKVTRGEEGRGRVEVSAPADRMSPAQWRQRLDTLFRGVEERLILSGAMPHEGEAPEG